MSKSYSDVIRITAFLSFIFMQITSKNALNYRQFYVHIFNTFRENVAIVPKWRVHILA